MPDPTDTRQFVEKRDITPDALNQRFRRLYQAWRLQIRTITAARTMDYTDDVVLGNASSGNFTVTLPTAVGITGRTYTIKSISTGTVTIDGAGSETIDGATTVGLSSQYQFRTIVSDGSNWSVIGRE